MSYGAVNRIYFAVVGAFIGACGITLALIGSDGLVPAVSIFVARCRRNRDRCAMSPANRHSDPYQRSTYCSSHSRRARIASRPASVIA